MRFMYDKFDSNYQATIGIDFLSKARKHAALPSPRGLRASAIGSRLHVVSGRWLALNGASASRVARGEGRPAFVSADDVSRRQGGPPAVVGHRRAGTVPVVDTGLHPGQRGGRVRVRRHQPQVFPSHAAMGEAGHSAMAIPPIDAVNASELATLPASHGARGA